MNIRTKGQGLVEYALIAILIAVVIIVFVALLDSITRPKLQGAYCLIQSGGQPDYTHCVTLVPTPTDRK